MLAQICFLPPETYIRAATRKMKPQLIYSKHACKLIIGIDRITRNTHICIQNPTKTYFISLLHVYNEVGRIHNSCPKSLPIASYAGMLCDKSKLIEKKTRPLGIQSMTVSTTTKQKYTSHLEILRMMVDAMTKQTKRHIQGFCG